MAIAAGLALGAVGMLHLAQPAGTMKEAERVDARTAEGLFQDFSRHDARHWHKADGWANGAPFANSWCANQVHISGGMMHLELRRAGEIDCRRQTLPWVSGEYRSNAAVGYGRIEARMRAAAGAGLVSSLFTYTGPSDGNEHHEVDVEILGADPTRLHLNYWVNGKGQHEHTLDLGFDASIGFHTYAFEWRPDSILWFVDGQLVHAVTTGPLPQVAGRVMMNLWPVDSSASDWAGAWAGQGRPRASYDWVRFTPLAALAIEDTQMALAAARAKGQFGGQQSL